MYLGRWSYSACCKYFTTSVETKSTKLLFNFEQRYERIGLPALLIMMLTGIRMAYIYNVKIESWFSFSNPVENVISTKLTCLVLIFLFAASAQFKVLPNLRKKYKILTPYDFPCNYGNINKYNYVNFRQFYTIWRNLIMKRFKELHHLSHDHHHGLLVCWKIRTAFSKGIDFERVKKYLTWFYEYHLKPF